MQSSKKARMCGGLIVALTATVLGACHQAKTTVATQSDVEAARDRARLELDQAHAEARKDVTSAGKVSGGNPKNVAVARTTGAFDIAMAQAEGDHDVALTECKTRDPALQPPCNEQADAAYRAAAAQAKEARLASRSRD